MLKKTVQIISSLTTGIILLSIVVMLMGTGSVTMLGTGGYETINAMPLFRWLKETAFSNSWWLILSLLCLVLVTINTVFCSVQSLIAKIPVRSLLLKISPQIMHAGFLFILLAHLFSSTDRFHFMTYINESQGIKLDDTTVARFTGISLSTSRTGFPTAMSAQVTIYEGQKNVLSKKISPNHPAFYNNLGIYLKNIQPYPYPRALIEISRDSGAPWALVGGIMFFAGNVLLVLLRLKHESLKGQNL